MAHVASRILEVDDESVDLRPLRESDGVLSAQPGSGGPAVQVDAANRLRPGEHRRFLREDQPSDWATLTGGRAGGRERLNLLGLLGSSGIIGRLDGRSRIISRPAGRSGIIDRPDRHSWIVGRIDPHSWIIGQIVGHSGLARRVRSGGRVRRFEIVRRREIARTGSSV